MEKSKKSILIIGSDHIGDNVLLIPTIQLLKNKGYEIYYFSFKRNENISYLLEKYVDKFITTKNFNYFLKLYDICLIPYPTTKRKTITSALMFRAKKYVSGYKTAHKWKKYFFEDSADLGLCFGFDLGFKMAEKILKREISQSEKEKIINSVTFTGKKQKKIIIYPAHAEKVFISMGLENIVELISKILPDYEIIFTGLEKEKKIFEKTKNKTKIPIKFYSGALQDIFNLLKDASAIIGYDGGISQLSALTNIPRLIFYPLCVLPQWKNPTKNSSIINLNAKILENCNRACFYTNLNSRKKPCPFNYECMNDVNFKDHENEIKNFLLKIKS